ncbi:MAG: adenosylcobinamide-phosphate synthase CbiB [Thermodesulfobacteriota bacterium]
MGVFTSDLLSAPVIASAALVAGLAADFIFADPPRLPHPVRLFGAVISRADAALNRGAGRAVKGAVFAVFFTSAVFWVFSLAKTFAASAGPAVDIAFSSLFVFFGLAGAGLTAECGAVFSALEENDTGLARRRLSMIVGRDTDKLCPARIRTAVLETMSENLSDGVVAPVFFYLIGGVPAMMAYKAVNTMDSMTGYKNSRYLRFGMAAARIDDAANFVPARITAFLMAAVAPSRRTFAFIFRFGRSHPSPNAGFPQAALAGILDCRFGGKATYGGELSVKPFIGSNPRALSPGDYTAAKKLNTAVTVLSAALAAAVEILI